jgi:cytochrome c oxidase assembly protein subunit 15
MFRVFSVAAAITAFLAAALGSWVRINGAGLTCPDWPLCRGAVVPSLVGGVVLEWTHRLVALVLSLLVIGALAAAWQQRNRIAYVRRVASVTTGIFFVQVLLGALTVRLANSPPSVAIHWATGMALLGGLVALASLAIFEPRLAEQRPAGPVGWLLTAVVALTFATMIAGSYYASSGAQAAQTIHRIAAGLLFGCATVATYWSLGAASTRTRVVILAMFALLVSQVMFGLANVAWNLPVVLREAHAVNACAFFVVSVCALLLGLLDGARVAHRVAPAVA